MLAFYPFYVSRPSLDLEFGALSSKLTPEHYIYIKA